MTYPDVVNLKKIKTLIYYDGDQLVLLGGPGSRQYLALHVSDDACGETWLYGRVTTQTVQMLLDGAVDLLSVFRSAVGSTLYFVTTQPDGTREVTGIPAATVNPKVLPDPGCYLTTQVPKTTHA